MSGLPARDWTAHGTGRSGAAGGSAAALAQCLAAALAARGGLPVTVSWDPEGLATGDGPVGGLGQGVYLVLTGNVMDDKPVLDEGDRLSRLQLARAWTTARAVRDRGRPVARVHLHHRWAGFAQLLDAAHQGGRA